MGTGKAPAGHFQCLGLTFQVRLLPSEESDHSLQLAELPVVGIDVGDAVNPGGRKGRRNPKKGKEKPQSDKCSWMIITAKRKSARNLGLQSFYHCCALCPL